MQVSHIDVSSESPVGHGCVICFSIYTSTSDAGEGALLLWVDTMLHGDQEEADAIFQEFKVFFEDDSLAKVCVWYCTGCVCQPVVMHVDVSLCRVCLCMCIWRSRTLVWCSAVH